MLYTIVILSKSRSRVVRRINEDTFYLAGKLLLQRLEREQVVAKDEPVVEDVLVADTLLGVVALLRVFKQDARLQPRPVLLANPCQFQFLLILHSVSYQSEPSLLTVLSAGRVAAICIRK